MTTAKMGYDFFMKKFFVISAFLIVAIAFFILGQKNHSFNIFASTQDKNAVFIDTVYNGYEQSKLTTVGKALDGSFDRPQWTTFETNKGHRIVEFTGYISDQTHDRALKRLLQFADPNKEYSLYQERQCYEFLSEIMGPDTINKLKENMGVKSDDFNLDFYKLIVDEAKNSFWQVGSQVKFQWTIIPKDNSFISTYVDNKLYGSFCFNIDQVWVVINN